MIIYAIFRALASVADLFWSGGIKNMFMGVTILIYGSIMALGLYYGVSLLSKMKTMQRSGAFRVCVAFGMGRSRSCAQLVHPPPYPPSLPLTCVPCHVNVLVRASLRPAQTFKRVCRS